uniref:Uncharacterized protein n=1 Tax=Arion vulgaris TaxID=1028688 RepID=A0A0B6YT17_9EUPU
MSPLIFCEIPYITRLVFMLKLMVLTIRIAHLMSPLIPLKGPPLPGPLNLPPGAPLPGGAPRDIPPPLEPPRMFGPAEPPLPLPPLPPLSLC